MVNSLGELASRTADGGQACDHHAQALALARDLGTPRRKHAPWKASAAAIFATATPSEAAACLEQALAIYQRIAAPAARRVQETLLQFRQGNLAPGPER